MNPVLEQIYSTILPAAPYVIAAYALIWVTLFVYMMIVLRGMKRSEQQISLLEDLLAEQKRTIKN